MNRDGRRSVVRPCGYLCALAFLLVPAAAVSAAGATGAASLAEFLDDAARPLSADLRRDLAGKPSPWIVKAHDVGPPTDVHRDIPWHLLDKEKDPRFRLPDRGQLGLFNPNADVHWLFGLSCDTEAIDRNPSRVYRDHLVNLAAQRIELGPVAGDLLFLPVTSDTVLAVLEFSSLDATAHTVHIETVVTKPSGPDSPAIDEPAAAWSRPTDRYGYGITVTSGKPVALEKAGPRAVCMELEELAPDKKAASGSLLCTLAGNLEPNLRRLDRDNAAGPRAGLGYRLQVHRDRPARMLLALNLHRYGPREIETRNQIVLYPAESDEQARVYASQAAHAALDCDWPALVRDGFRWYERMPVIDLPEKRWNANFYCALELPRGNTWSAQGVLKQPWYTFCRVHGHEPYGWWSYGMHAHEHLSTFVVNLTEPALSQSYLRGHFQTQQADGCIQYGVNQSGKNFHAPLATAPLLAGEAWQAYLWSGDREFLAEAYRATGNFVRWWRSPARTRNVGPTTSPVGRNVSSPALQYWRDFVESVRDDKDLATWTATGGAENQAALDLNCYLLNEESVLSDMARELGLADEAAAWQADAVARTETMRTHLWHAEDGVFYGRDLIGDRWARVMDVSTFFPLWCGLATPAQADSIVRLLGDPDAFDTAFPVPTLAVRHMPDKQRGSYHWRGANWVEMTWPAVQGLSRYGHDAEAARIAEADCRMVFDTLERTGHFREFYNSLNGEPSDLTDYIWTAMPAIMIVETFLGIRPTADVLEIRPALPAGWRRAAIDNLRVRGKLVSVRVTRDSDRSTFVSVNDRTPVPLSHNPHIPWPQVENGASP